MFVSGIDHINIAGSRELIARCRTFYVELLGLTDGSRPPFRSRGFWLYAGEHPIVHLSERDIHDVDAPANPFNHFALSCRGVEAAIERLQRHGIAFSIDRVPDSHRVQLFLHDPAGIGVELNFPNG